MRCARPLKADNASDLTPERGLPSVHFKLLGVELGRWQCGVGLHCVVGRNVFGTKFQLALALVATVGQAVYRETQVRQYVIVDDVVEEDRIRVEGILRQDDAIIKCVVLTDGFVPGSPETLL